MATYANPSILKWTLLVTNTIIFFLTIALLMYTLVDYVGFENETNSEHKDDTEVDKDDGNFDYHDDDQPNEDKPLHPVNQFPSIGSTSVRVIVPMITMSVSIVGIIAANDGRVRLLNINGYLCFLSFFIKYLFIFVSLRMAGLSSSYESLGSVIFPLYLTIGLVELILGMSSCQLSSIIKRGVSAKPRIEKLPVASVVT
uniref:Uncharacterized protein n=1 Tax=Tetranychus urticae TaxID=32264 RepID=T1KJD7_TETUR